MNMQISIAFKRESKLIDARPLCMQGSEVSAAALDLLYSLLHWEARCRIGKSAISSKRYSCIMENTIMHA